MRLDSEVLGLEIGQLLVDIRREYAFVAETSERLVESTKPGK